MNDFADLSGNMSKLLFKIWFPLAVVLFATPGCAAQLKEAAAITRLGYSIQVGAFAEVKNAERLSARLQTKGIDAFYFRKESGVYAVRFGDYSTRESARKAAAKLAAEKIISDYFIAPPADANLIKPRESGRPAGRGGASRAGAGRDMGNIAARTAERFVGIPYQWGGNNVVEGMDCSGFVRAVYNLCGVNIPRNSRDQYKVGESISRNDLRDGDLVFFGSSEDAISHVGIYVGGGRFVHAPRRGDEIKISHIDEQYFADRFVGAKRYF